MAETELKLYAAPGDLPKLQAAILQLAAVLGKPRTRRVVTDYYETPDLALAKSGVALRVRRTGRHLSQGLRSRQNGAAGRAALAASRGEWEWPMEGRAPNFRPLNQEAIADLVPVHALCSLEKLFRTEIERTTFRIKSDDATEIEVSFDRGRIVADGKSVPVCEMELELRSAEHPHRVVTLYRLALELQSAAPITLGTESKADRGYRLVTRATPGAVKAADLALDDSVTVRAGIRAILRGCTMQIAANKAAALTESETGGVHQMRVGVRRLGTALRLFRNFIASPETSWIEGEVKWLADELGHARDWDVLTTHTLALVKNEVSPAAIDSVARAAEKRRRAAHAAVADAVAGPRYTTLLLTLGAWIEEDRWSERLDDAALQRLDAPLADAAPRLLARLGRKVRKAGRDIEAAAPSERHKLRKALKKLHYGAQFLASLYGRKRVKRYLGRVSDLQDTLGALNDFAVAQKLLQDLAARQPGARGAANRLRRSLGALARAQAKDLEADWRRYEKLDPFWA